MASIEQEALDDIIKDFNEFNKKDIMFVPPQYDFDVLQKAIDDLELYKKENKKLKDENFRLYKELAEVQNVSISSARGNFLFKYRKELENGK